MFILCGRVKFLTGTIKKILSKLVWIIEEFIPTLGFLVIFSTFIIGIFSRYVFRSPVPWTYEVSILAYMWTVYFACGLAMKKKEHVVFSLFYDSRSEKTKKILRVTGNALIAVSMLIILVPSIKGILYKSAITGVLRIPVKYAFLPFLLLIVDVFVRSVYNIYIDFAPIQEDKLKK